jgi:hypothetical protein
MEHLCSLETDQDVPRSFKREENFEFACYISIYDGVTFQLVAAKKRSK